MKFTAIVATILAVATPVFSTVYITNPVASTSIDGGKSLRVQWQDSNASPKITAWEGLNVWLAAGSEASQFKLAQIASNLGTDRNSVSYTIPKNLGPSGKYYFIRMESTKLAPNGTAFAMSFSARFNLDDMSGTFNSTVMAAAQGKEGSASSSVSSSSRGMATSTSAAVAAAQTLGSSSATSAKASSTGTTSGAAGRFVGQNAIAAGLSMGAVAAGAIALL